MAGSSRCVERSVRIYKALIKAYPAAFRQEYGSEMIGVFRDLATDAWLRQGRIGLLMLWFRVCRPRANGSKTTLVSFETQ